MVKYVIPSYEIIEIKNDSNWLYKHIEECGRTAYQSFDKISNKSFEPFIRMILKRSHESVIEHSLISIELSDLELDNFKKNFLTHKCYSEKFIHITKEERNIISANHRTFRDLFRFYHKKTIHPLFNTLYLKYPLLYEDLNEDLINMDKKNTFGIIIEDKNDFTKSEKLKHISLSVRFKNVPRSFTHQLVRMRSLILLWKEDMNSLNCDLVSLLKKAMTEEKENRNKIINAIINLIEDNENIKETYNEGFSFTQESQRYCDYTKTKFGKGLTVVKAPIPLSKEEEKLFNKAYLSSENIYADLRHIGVSPEIARGVLPIDSKSEIVATGSLENWFHTFIERTHKSAHPFMRNICRPLCKDFKKLYPHIFNEIKW